MATIVAAIIFLGGIAAYGLVAGANAYKSENERKLEDEEQIASITRS